MKANLRRRIVTAVIILYSVFVLSSATPRFANVSNIPVILYFLLVPGFAMTLLIREEYTLLERIAFAILLSLGPVLTLLATREMFYPANFPLPYDVIIPIFTIVLTVYYYFARASGVRAIP